MREVEKPASVRAFVKDILGCNCPEEVFETMVTDALSYAYPGISGQRLVVGDRLLIYIIDFPQAANLTELLPRLLLEGKNERNSKGYNRFRLVIAGSCSQEEVAAATAQFSSICRGDDQLHLHFIPKHNLPNL